MEKLIYGAGGGDEDEPRAAVEYPDTLKSKSYVRVIDLLGEGEFEEVLVGGLRGLYVDEVPVQNGDGTLNYTGLNVETRHGTLSQSRMNIADTVENTESVGIVMTKDNPVEKVVSVANSDMLRVNVRIPALTLTNTSNGDLEGTSVQYKIEWKELSSPTWNTVTEGTYITENKVLSTNVQEAVVTGYVQYSCSIDAYANHYYGEILSTYGGAKRYAFGTSSIQMQTNTNGAGWVTVKLQRFTNQVSCLDQIYNFNGSTQVTNTDPADTVTPYTYSATITANETDVIKIRTIVTTSELPSISYSAMPANNRSRNVGTATIRSVSGKRTRPTGVQTVSGKSSGEYERQTSFRISGEAPWIVRCTRITDDSPSSYLQNKTIFASVTSVIEEKFRYPGSVLVGMQVDAEQFSSLPSRGYLCKCLKVKVPTNYDPIARTYSGIWDGSFKIAWTDNPAWCFYDLLTNTRYGLGDRIDLASIDKESLYSIAQYCDELVVGEDGVYEPRFTCNVVIQTKEEAYKVINDFASVFRGITYWGSGAVVPVQDSPKTASYAFNNSNVVDGIFTYQSSPLSTRYNAVGVTWISPRNGYKREIEYVEDTDLINNLGYVNQIDVVAFGCTSRAMARRVGKWLIYTNNYQTDIVTFSTGLEGVLPMPGDVIKISDTLRSLDRRGGRIKSSTLSGAVLDAPMSFTVGVEYTFTAVDEDGNLVDRTFTSGTTTDTIVFDEVLTKPLAINSVFVIADNNIEPQEFKIVSVAEKGNGIYEVNALSHNSSKYAYIEQDVPLSNPNIGLDQRVFSVLSATKNEFMYKDGVSVKNKVVISWQAPRFTSKYIVSLRSPDGNITQEVITTPEYQILGAQEGDNTLTIITINIFGEQSNGFVFPFIVHGKTTLPSVVEDFSVTASNGNAVLRWKLHPDLDVQVGGFVEIRHSSKTVNAVWGDGIEIASVQGGSTSTTTTLLGGTYMAKAVDSSGNYSTSAAYALSSYALLQGVNIIEQIEEHPTFAGQKTNFVVSGNKLVTTSVLTIDEAGYIDDYTLFDFLGGDVNTFAEYIFDNKIDLTVPCVSAINATIKSSVISPAFLIDARTDLMDSWAGFDENIQDLVSRTLYVSTTDDDPTGPPFSTPVWSDWKKFYPGVYQNRAYKFKLVVESTQPTSGLEVEELSILVDMEDRIESEQGLICPVSSLSVSFDIPFAVTPAIAVTVNNMQSGDYINIPSKSAWGFSVVVLNDSSPGPVERTINYIARGYGKRL